MLQILTKINDNGAKKLRLLKMYGGGFTYISAHRLFRPVGWHVPTFPLYDLALQTCMKTGGIAGLVNSAPAKPLAAGGRNKTFCGYDNF